MRRARLTSETRLSVVTERRFPGEEPAAEDTPLAYVRHQNRDTGAHADPGSMSCVL